MHENWIKVERIHNSLTKIDRRDTINRKNERRGASVTAAERSFELRPFALQGREPDADNADAGSISSSHHATKDDVSSDGMIWAVRFLSGQPFLLYIWKGRRSIHAGCQFFKKSERKNAIVNATSKRTMNLVLAGVMVAMATVLSFIKPFGQLPYGGSVTVCSMLPIMFFSYRCGLKWGLSAGFVFSVIQLLLGLGDLRGLTPGTLIGSIFLDYILAFTVLGLGGMFRGKIKNDAAAFTLGSFVAMMLRYFCSFLSGWVLWAALSDATDMQGFIAQFIPALANVSGTTLAIVYSLVYNGVYMIPEMVLTCVVGFLLVQLAGDQILEKKIETWKS